MELIIIGLLIVLYFKHDIEKSEIEKRIKDSQEVILARLTTNKIEVCKMLDIISNQIDSSNIRVVRGLELNGAKTTDAITDYINIKNIFAEAEIKKIDEELKKLNSELAKDINNSIQREIYKLAFTPIQVRKRYE